MTNTGTTDLYNWQDNIIGGAGVFGFSPEECSGHTIEPGGSCTIGVIFLPNAAGPQSATLQIGTQVAGVQQIPITAVGSLTSPNFSVSPSNADYGLVRAGTYQMQDFTVTNTSSASIFMSTNTMSSPFFIYSDGCHFVTLAQNGDQCTIHTLFSPSGAGAFTSNLHITSTAGYADVALSGTGFVPAAAADVSPTNYDYGTADVGAMTSQTFTVSSAASGVLSITAVSLGGTNPGDYAVTDDACTGANLPSGSVCTVTVAFGPTATGLRNATLQIASNDPASPDLVPLSGTGLNSDPNQASGDPGPGGTVSTGTGAATSSDPTTTAVTAPAAGTVTISESTGGTPPSGYGLVGQTVSITAPVGTFDHPIRITFRLDASAIPPGHDATTIEVFRNGILLPECATPGSGRAVDDPCIDQRSTLVDGDISITALTTHASLWQLGVVNPYAFAGFFAPVDNAPTVNKATAGQAVPVKFSLGSNLGMDIFAGSGPFSQKTTCDSGAPVDAIETVVAANQSSLSYIASSNQYQFVWKTDKSWAGTCRTLSLHFADGSTHTAVFSFKK